MYRIKYLVKLHHLHSIKQLSTIHIQIKISLYHILMIILNLSDKDCLSDHVTPIN